MKDLIVTSQAELDAVPANFDGRVIIKFGTPYNRAVVNRAFKRSVEAWDNSSVVARDNSSVEARGNSSVVARDNSSVEAWGNSSVEARGNSSVVARDNSSVVARDNSSVEAWGNAQIVDAARCGNIKATGNARIVYNLNNISDWAESNGIEIENGKIKLYKAVHKRGGKYTADWDSGFVYTIGAVAKSVGFCADPSVVCGAGIHMATAAWAAQYGSNWSDLALLELECDAETVVVPLYEPDKVRAPRAKVLREVPLVEAGLKGKIIAKRRANE